MAVPAELLNNRTATKAAIKRASKKARFAMRSLDSTTGIELSRLYENAVLDLYDRLALYADRDQTLRLQVLQTILSQINERLSQLAVARDAFLMESLKTAANHGASPFEGSVATGLTQVADAAVQFVVNFTANDGLQLSDRIWRNNAHMRRVVSDAISSAVIQGHSASQAAQEFLSRGQSVPPDVRDQARLAGLGNVRKVLGGALMTGAGSPYDNARRLFRTEINRAHGEAYRAGAFEHPDVIGTRFLLGKGHPRPDICDMHASVNRYGLGKGVYPKGKSPWPAHPNTLSFEEAVFADEVTAEDRAGKQDRIGWLRGQSQSDQIDILGKRKAAALQKEILTENEIATPWNVLKEKYIKKGIDVGALVIREKPVVKLKKPALFGRGPELDAYIEEAFAESPDVVRKVRDKMPPVDVSVQEGESSFYQRYGKYIVLKPSSMREGWGRVSKHDVYRHEFGHHVDFYGAGFDQPSQLSMMKATRGGLYDDISQARLSLHARTAEQKARRARLRYELSERGDVYLADLFGALTRNKVGWGHTNRYYERIGSAETEAFANLFNLYARVDRSAWDYAATELPDLADAFEKLLGRLS